MRQFLSVVWRTQFDWETLDPNGCLQNPMAGTPMGPEQMADESGTHSKPAVRDHRQNSIDRFEPGSSSLA